MQEGNNQREEISLSTKQGQLEEKKVNWENARKKKTRRKTAIQMVSFPGACHSNVVGDGVV